MSIFLDASAIVAILAREPEAYSFDERITVEADLLTSAIAIWKASRGLAVARGIAFEEARAAVSRYVADFAVRLIAIGADEAEAALDAHQRFGKGRHPARLNMGDCFAYACTTRHADMILFKGDDFIHTDLKDATLS
ncbi:type II toxin-antitoxin system VapC family toxin [Sphingomonas sp.]|uniref:type II toxin-antitoxin system VapC family toxin n=1 Tax=Sphingomonas sp. TaxID=28214 RepID=UPI002EDB8927